MSLKHPLLLQGAPAPPPCRHNKNVLSEMLFLFQNASELSDEELNDDLLQSDEEDIDMGFVV